MAIGKRVIVRGFGDQPSVLTAVGWLGDRIILEGPTGATINLPIEDVYNHSEGLLGRLRAAYDEGESERLSAEWERAERPQLGNAIE